MGSSDEFFEAGVRLMGSGNDGEAIAAFTRALETRPLFPEARTNLGILLQKMGSTAQAEASFRLALAMNPESPETLSNLANLLSGIKRFDEAETLYRRALSLQPLAATYSNYAVLLACLKRESEAESCFQTALLLDPENPRTRFNYSYLLLRNGRYREGWALLESRHEGKINTPDLPFERWRGKPLSGKSILIWPELGFGDQIQFCRYAPLLKKAGASRVVLSCPKELELLFTSLEGIEVMPADVRSERFDYWTMPLSIPNHFAFIPENVPYLHADPEKMAKWQARLPEDGKRKIGLVWKGNPLHENDDRRSLCSLTALAPLWDAKDASFFSLQKGEGEKEATSSALPLAHLGSEITDFADSAAIISMLDLVISVDTSIAHLAGAMGKPCWVLLPYFKTDWRWLKDRSDSPWYPSIRLFRQKQDNDWESVIREIRDALINPGPWQDRGTRDASCPDRRSGPATSR